LPLWIRLLAMVRPAAMPFPPRVKRIA